MYPAALPEKMQLANMICPMLKLADVLSVLVSGVIEPISPPQVEPSVKVTVVPEILVAIVSP
jgi:hypothetical protein